MHLGKYIKIRHLLNWAGKNSRLSLLAIVLFGTVAIMTNLNNGKWNNKQGVVIHDIISYYSYLPALFIHHDLSFSYLDKNPKILTGKDINSKTREVGHYQKMTMGLSFLYLPFFLLGYASAWFIGTPLDGFSYPFMCCILFSSVFYVLIGLFFLRKTLLLYFNDKTTALTLIFITLGTNLYFYTTLEGAMSHAYTFSLIAVFVYLTITWHEQPTWKNSIITGLVYGLITLIRPTNGLIILFFLLFNILNYTDLKIKFKFYISHFYNILAIAFFAFLVIFPQLLFWKFNTGHWIFYTYKEEGFFFSKPEIIRGLFSYRKGWLVYTPIMVFAIAGIFLLRKRLSIFFLPIIIFSLLNIYVIFSWWDWSYGGSFGARAMIDSYALMAISMATFTETILNTKTIIIRVGTLILLFILVLFSLFQTAQYKYGAIHFCEMSKEAYWHSFGKLSCDMEYYDLLERLDYKKLIKGEYGIVPRIRKTISTEATTGFDELSQSGTHFISPDKHYEFSNASNQNQINKHSGQSSILLSGETKFGAGIDFIIKPHEKYILSVWKYPLKARAALVFASPNVNLFYKEKEITLEADSTGWGLISFEAEIPEGRTGKYHVYLWNKTTDSVFFDDLSIRKLN